MAATAPEIVYVADRANFPYGERTGAQLTDLLLRLMSRIYELIAPDLAVLACNTASVTALQTLRARFSLPIVGVVPAVKPAATASRSKRIGVLSTSATARASYLDNLIRTHANGCAVELFPAASLVDWVENEMPFALESDRAGCCLQREAVDEVAKMIGASDVDQIVLGCTHFLHLKRTLLDSLHDSVNIVDSADGVARQIERIATSLMAQRAGARRGDPAGANDVERKGERRGVAPGRGRHRLYLTADGPWRERYEAAARAFELHFAGVL